jgi:uncharacterized membrane protein YjjP (DUF1212 family)
MSKVIIWRILSIILCTLMARVWFGDWHVTLFGIFISTVMTFVHYYFEKAWKYYVVNGNTTL